MEAEPPGRSGRGEKESRNGKERIMLPSQMVSDLLERKTGGKSETICFYELICEATYNKRIN